MPSADGHGVHVHPPADALRILHLEDEANDATLVHAALEADGLRFALRRARTGPEFEAALGRGAYDVILSDFALPGFDGLRALELARSADPEIPFIFVSGTIGEEMAIAAVRNGATDYVLKHRLTRLAPAVRRAISEAEERARLRETEEALRRSEEQLLQAQKMEAIGRLAAGVAHDFNNLLTAIIGYSELVIRELGPGHPVLSDLQEVHTAGERAADLTRQLLAFSRQQVIELKPVDLNAVILDTDKMLRRVIGADIDLVTKPGAGVGPILADRGQIEQVLLNLVVNARDAMPDGGRLTIATSEVPAPGDEDEAPARQVVLEVTDDGIGMDETVQARIFEPFFTTKELGKGTGLGLSTVFGIVKQSSGSIEVQSKPGRGTTFRVSFPRADAVVERARPENEFRDVSGSESVLVVDDDDAVRHLARHALALHGYSVHEAEDGHQALRILDNRSLDIRLLVTDLVMPGMGGAELITCALNLRPGIKVLCMSGYAPDDALREATVLAQAPFLQKPFSPHALAGKVRDVLDSVRKAA